MVLSVLLAAPRRSGAIPNASGTLIAYTQTTYSFSSHMTSSELRVLDVASKKSVLITDSFKGEPQWLGSSDQLVWLKGSNNGNTSIVIGNAAKSERPYVAGIIPGPTGDLKLIELGSGEFGFAVSGKANPDGSLYNPSDAKTPLSTGKLYTSLFVRHWDEYISPQKSTIWFGTLQPSSTVKGPIWKLCGFANLFQLAGLNNVESPIAPFGGTDNFDICSRGIAFVSKDPALNPATHTKCVCYYCPLPSWANPSPMQARAIDVPSLHGALTCPVFSPIKNSLAFLAMKQDGYESDKNRIVLVQDLFGDTPEVAEIFATANGAGEWDRSPSSITWAHDDSLLYIQAPDVGREILFQLSFDGSKTASEHRTNRLVRLTDCGSVSSVVSRQSGVFISSSSLVESSVYSVITSRNGFETTVLSSNSRGGASFGLSLSQVDEIWWKGAKDRDVHGWIMKPSKFNPKDKYPLCFLVHGGPQSAWMDSWSTRWNPAIFAEQGYVVITPNPTGSTSYGQEFTDDIQGSWGGQPYEDLVKAFEFIEQNLDFVDTNRAVALGASYGGFMMNWIQGHDLGRKFKALVTHDGIFSTKFALATEELYFPIHDLKGTYWQSRDVWQRWDPSEFISNWQTPHLVIHNTLDYRLSIAEGLATFNVLQMRGVESAFLTFPDENHWVLKPENSLVWHRSVINWINKYAGLPLWLDENGEDGYPSEEKTLPQATARLSIG